MNSELEQAIDERLRHLYIVTETALTNAATGTKGKYGTSERDSWSRTQPQAKDYLNDPTRNLDNVPDLAQEAWSSSGRTGSFRDGLQPDKDAIKPLVENLATRIIEKAKSLGEQAAAIKGNRNRLEAQLQSFRTNPNSSVEQVEGFSIFQGFPPELI